jgi:hypothetical protein
MNSMGGYSMATNHLLMHDEVDTALRYPTQALSEAAVVERGPGMKPRQGQKFGGFLSL